MINPINGIKFTKQEQKNILNNLSKIRGMAHSLRKSKDIHNINDIDYLVDIEHLAFAIFSVLDNKFYLESTPRKEENHE